MGTAFHETPNISSNKCFEKTLSLSFPVVHQLFGNNKNGIEKEIANIFK